MPITPETKIGDFLEAHPELQEALIERVPQFAKLRNPILRRTVAKLATVEQAARIAGLPTAELVTFLRQLAGEATGCETSSSAPVTEEPRPAWAQGSPRFTLDAETLLAGGGHPLAKTRQTLSQLTSGETLVLRSAFRPEPLLDQMRQEGLPCWCERSEENRFVTWILKV